MTNTLGVSSLLIELNNTIETEPSFRFEYGDGSFTAIKEIRKGSTKTPRNPQEVWYAHRRINNKLYRKYIGYTQKVTIEKLQEIGEYFTLVNTIPRTQLAKLRANAISSVCRAVKKGILVKPSICELCNTKTETSSGRSSTVVAHHYAGYQEKNRLKIWWICKRCNWKLRNVHDGSLSKKEAKGYIKNDEGN